MDLKIHTAENQGKHELKVIGEIDAFTAPKLKEYFENLQGIQNIQVIVDVSEVEYMDSTGLGVFVGFYKAAKDVDGHLKVIGLNKRLLRLFEITGLNEIIDVESED